MSVSTIRGKSNSFVSYLPYIIGVIGMGLVIYFGIIVVKNLDKFKGKAVLEARLTYNEADVLINDQKVGKTPLEGIEVSPGDNKITLRGNNRQYETTLNFIPNTKDTIFVVGVFSDLGISDYFSSNHDIWYEKDKSGNVLRVVSEPSGATVYIDNVEQGKTPFSSDKLSQGDYTLRIDAPGYESQESRINISKGYILNLKAKLFPYPVPTTVRLLKDSTNFYDISSPDTNLTSDTQTWTKAIIYWNTTRGINLEDVGANKDKLFDFFIDYKGNLFDDAGNQITNKEDYTKFKDAKRGAYLGRTSDPEGLTPEAKETFLNLNAAGIGGKVGKILETGTGWLRVRDAANLNGIELTRVDVGKEYTVIEETTGWVKIKASDTIEGWVSADYISVK